MDSAVFGDRIWDDYDADVGVVARAIFLIVGHFLEYLRRPCGFLGPGLNTHFAGSGTVGSGDEQTRSNMQSHAEDSGVRCPGLNQIQRLIKFALRPDQAHRLAVVNQVSGDRPVPRSNTDVSNAITT